MYAVHNIRQDIIINFNFVFVFNLVYQYTIATYECFQFQLKILGRTCDAVLVKSTAISTAEFPIPIRENNLMF